jgi:hypothetical protein
MRQDMKDLLLETGRNGGYGKQAISRRARIKRADADELPQRLSSNRKRVGDKEISDRLRPLFKFLKANCGRPWDDVYRDICTYADSRTIRGYHLRQHVWQYVVPNNYDVGHTGRYGPFFVDPDGILQEERKLTRAESRARWKNSPYNKDKKENPRIVVDADHHFERIEGYWFSFETKHYTYPCSYEDLVEKNGVIEIVRIKCPDVTKHVTSKKQVNGKTQKELDIKYGKTRRDD